MKEFSVFEPVLIRISKYDRWTADFYDYPNDDSDEHYTITGALISDSNILPYNEKTKHLHNNVGEFVEWKPKKGEPILVKDPYDETWIIRIFLAMQNNRYVCTSSLDNDCVNTTVAWDLAKPYINPYKE
jgi:hypothetical protein